MMAPGSRPVSAARIDPRFKANRAVKRNARFTRGVRVRRRPIELATTAGSNDTKPAPRSMAMIRVDHAALQRGAVEGEEICDLPGLGPDPGAYRPRAAR